MPLGYNIVAVDDSPGIRQLIQKVAGTVARVTTAPGGAELFELLENGEKVDLILLDVSMPEMSGYEVIQHLKDKPETQSTPVIFLTAHDNKDFEEKGLRLGAVDYITKPISPATLIARVQNHLELKAARDHIVSQNEILEQRVQERTRELALTQDLTILSLASLAETRDNETGNHIRRTQSYVRILADHLLETGVYADQLSPEINALLEKSAPLHDIGKVGVPDAVLLKPGKLDEAEFEIIKTHPYLGMAALQGAEDMLGTTSFLRFAKEIVYSHHEKWDGSGYPQGLSGFDIPLSARLMAAADVYDALISKRVYKPPFSHEEAIELIVEGKGKHFDPAIVDAVVVVAGRFRETAERYKD